MTTFLGTVLPHNKSALPVTGSGTRTNTCSAGMHLAKNQEGSPDAPLSAQEIILLEIFGSVFHCAVRASGKITMAFLCSLG